MAAVLPSSPVKRDAGCRARAGQASRRGSAWRPSCCASVGAAGAGSLQPVPGCWGSAGLRHARVAGRGVSPVSAACSLPSGLLLDDSQMVIALLLFPVTFVTLGRQSAESEIEAGVRDVAGRVGTLGNNTGFKARPFTDLICIWK